MTDAGAAAVFFASGAIVICAFLAVVALNNWIEHRERMIDKNPPAPADKETTDAA